MPKALTVGIGEKAVQKRQMAVVSVVVSIVPAARFHAQAKRVSSVAEMPGAALLDAYHVLRPIVSGGVQARSREMKARCSEVSPSTCPCRRRCHRLPRTG